MRPAQCAGCAIALAALLSSCDADAVGVAPPEPSADAVGPCNDLLASLPDAIEEGDRRTVEPVSPYVIAWADPAIVLSCGVPAPAEFQPTSVLATVNGVDWLPVQDQDGYSFYATGRVVWVRVDVPAAYAPETFALTEISDVVVGLPLERVADVD